MGNPTYLKCPMPCKSKPIVPGSPTSLKCPMPRKTRATISPTWVKIHSRDVKTRMSGEIQKSKRCGVRYWVQIRSRDASTQWKWRTRWTIRTMPNPTSECCQTKLSKVRLEAWQSRHLTDVYTEEVLGERPNVYLHSCPGIAP